MLRPFHEEVSALDYVYRMAFTGCSYRVKHKQKGSESVVTFDGRKIKIPSNGMLHSTVPRVPTDLEPRLSFT